MPRAGGTRQWDVAISKGVRDNTWDQGFMIHHAVVDAIYAAKLCRERGLPALAVVPMVATALAFAYLLNKYDGVPLATHAIVQVQGGIIRRTQDAEVSSLRDRHGQFST